MRNLVYPQLKREKAEDSFMAANGSKVTIEDPFRVLEDPNQPET
jgi:hypothetical protein